MEKTVEIIIWSDNSELEQIANIIHDYGYHTAEIRKEELGAYENACNWGWCKANMMDSVCVLTCTPHWAKSYRLHRWKKCPCFAM